MSCRWWSLFVLTLPCSKVFLDKLTVAKLAKKKKRDHHHIGLLYFPRDLVALRSPAIFRGVRAHLHFLDGEQSVPVTSHVPFVFMAWRVFKAVSSNAWDLRLREASCYDRRAYTTLPRDCLTTPS